MSVTTPVSATNALKVKVRYQQKVLNAGNKIDIGIELNLLSSKVITDLAYHEIFTRCLRQEIDASRLLVLFTGTLSAVSASRGGWTLTLRT